MLAAPGHQVELDAAALEIVEHLVGHGAVAVGRLPQFANIGNIEIADAPVDDLAILFEFRERRDGFVQWYRAAPVQQIKVDSVGLQPLEARPASLDPPALRSISRQHLADD